MKLYYAAASPFVRKVLVVLHETEQLDDVEIQPVVTTPLAPDGAVLGKNPLAKIPALERDDGPTLYDSRVICAFLDDRAKAGLYPQDTSRWETLTLEATADGIMDAGVLMVYESRFRPEALQSQDWIEGQWSKIDRALTVLNDRWMPHLTGHLNIGQIGVACALGYLDFRHDARNWREGRPDLADWHARFSERPSMGATRPTT